MTSLQKYLRLQWYCIASNIASRMAYRGDFFVSLCAMALSTIVPVIYILILYGATAGFAGWSFTSILLLTGVVSLGEGAAYFLTAGILWNTIERVERGTFDTILLAPENTLWYFMSQSTDIEDIGKFLAGALVFFYAVAISHLPFLHVLLLLFCSLLAFLFFSSIAILGSATSIRFINTWRVYEFMETLQRISKYPVNIFPRVLSTLFLTLIPVAAIGYVPVGVVVGILPITLLFSTLCVIALFLFSIGFWKQTLNAYTSAGG